MLSPKRKGRITGSIAGAILGQSPFMTRDDVMRSMVRYWHGAESEFVGNVATEWGTANEPHVIAMAQNKYADLKPNEHFFIDSLHDWLGATPDGLIALDAVYELKCPFGKRKDEAPEFKPAQELMHYYTQMQIEMLCSKRWKCLFHQWTPKAECLEWVRFDEGYMQEILPKLETFYNEYLEERENNYQQHLEPKVKVIESSKAAETYKSAKEAYEAAKAELDKAKSALIEQANGKKSKIAGLDVYEVQKAGSIKYSAVVKEHLGGVDLEPYRGKPRSYWVVK